MPGSMAMACLPASQEIDELNLITLHRDLYPFPSEQIKQHGKHIFAD